MLTFYNVKCLTSYLLPSHFLLPVWIYHFKAVILKYVIRLCKFCKISHVLLRSCECLSWTWVSSVFIRVIILSSFLIHVMFSRFFYTFVPWLLETVLYLFHQVLEFFSGLNLDEGLLGSKFYNGYWQSIFQNGLRTRIPSKSIWNLPFIFLINNTWYCQMF